METKTKTAPTVRQPAYWRLNTWLVPVDAIQAASENVMAEWTQLKNHASRLTNSERQRLAVLTIELSPSCCPICELPIHQVAAGVAAKYLDAKNSTGPTAFRCACCGVELTECVPLMAPPAYFWRAKLTPAQVDTLREQPSAPVQRC